MSATSTEDNGAWACRGAVGAGGRVIEQGECLESIAVEAGLHWQTIWDHPDNADLKAARKDPFVLLPGDRLHVPDKQARWESCATDRHHRFVVKNRMSRFRLLVKEEDQPRANEPYTLDVDGVILSGQTTADGLIDQPVKSGSRRVLVTLGSQQETFAFKLGAIDPIDEPTGIQARLRNLGLYDGVIDGVIGPMTLSAMRLLQGMLELPATGEPDADTLDALRREHGC